MQSKFQKLSGEMNTKKDNLNKVKKATQKEKSKLPKDIMIDHVKNSLNLKHGKGKRKKRNKK